VANAGPQLARELRSAGVLILGRGSSRAAPAPFRFLGGDQRPVLRAWWWLVFSYGAAVPPDIRVRAAEAILAGADGLVWVTPDRWDPLRLPIRVSCRDSVSPKRRRAGWCVDMSRDWRSQIPALAGAES
jgi:hypothetical protein